VTDPLPGQEEPDKKKPNASLSRIGIWIGVGAIALYLIISGIVGIIVKGG
jgi:hypothetical protein